MQHDNLITKNVLGYGKMLSLLKPRSTCQNFSLLPRGVAIQTMYLCLFFGFVLCIVFTKPLKTSLSFSWQLER
jgi:hypothetical protein